MRLTCILLGLGVFGVSLYSQNAGLSGTVTDPAKAVVPGATVTAIKLDTRTEQKTVTNSSGIYLLPQLPPGNYEIQVHKEGFQTTVRRDLELHVSDHAQLDFEIKVGSTTQTVAVTGAAELVNTSDASVGTVVDRQFVANMPLNGRSFQSLISLTPGVVIAGGSSGSPGQFSINGQRPDSNYFTVDGVSANVGVASGGSVLAGSAGSGVQPSSGGGYNNLVSVDAMQEFKIQTSTFAPEYGRTPGGQISIVTRSGTNQFHGDVFDYFRNNVLDAGDWFLNARGAAHPPERQNDFGGVFGGPIKKDKLFFFGSYEGLRLTLPAQINTFVPSLCARGTGPCPAGVTPVAASVQPYLNAFPLPTPGNCAGILTPTSDPKLSPFCAAYPAKTQLDGTSIRGDYSINSKMSLFARWNYAPSSYTTRSASATSLMKPEINLTTYTGGFTYTITPTLVNDVHFNYSFATGYAISTVDDFGGAVALPNAQLFPSAISVPGASPVSVDNSRIFFTITPASSWRSGVETKNESRQYDYVESLSWSRGSHQMKFGADIRRLLPVQARAGYQQSITFSTTASLTAGLVDNYTVGTNPYSEFQFNNYSFYAQDTWKVSPRLTVTYGLRWDYNPSPGTLNNVPFLSYNQLDLKNLSGTIVQPFGADVYRNQKNAFAPRIGVAYQLSQDPRWARVIRAGWGLFFDTTGDIISQLSTVAGSNSVFVAGGQFPALTQFPPTLAQETPAPAVFVAPFPVVTATDPNLRNPHVHQLNVAFEQSLGIKQSMTLTYAAAIGRNLFVYDAFPGQPANTPSGASLPLGFEAITNGSTSDYHSFQALFQRRLSGGLQAMASYTWAHSIDTASQVNYLRPNPNILSPNSERGASDFDIRHSLQSAVNYSLPLWGTNRLVNAVLSHWGTDLIFRARSAPPINVVDGNAFFTGGLYPNIRVGTRPSLNPGAPVFLYGDQCGAAYAIKSCPGGFALNPGSALSKSLGIPAAFARPLASCPATGICQSPVQGSLGRNALRGFDWSQLDFTLRREFPIHEKIAMQFRSDFFNLLNHPSFAFPPGNGALSVSNAAFGRPISMLNNALASTGGVPAFNPLYQIGGPRSIQLSLKLIF